MTSSVWRRQQPYFVLGLFLGAVTVGTLVGALGGIVHLVPVIARTVLAVAAVGVILAFELSGRPLHLPQNHRAVPQTIIPRSNVDGPLQFGFEMGTGLRTFMPTALPHALVLTVLLVGGILPGVLAGVGFGLGRSLMPLGRVWSGDPRGWDNVLLRHLRWIGRVCAAGFLLAVATVLLVTQPWH